MSCDNPVIQVESVSKYFEIYSSPEDRLRQIIMPKLKSGFGLRNDRDKYHRKFWALHDVSFEVQKGQTVGIIGRNGSGKSTLLQIITGTMLPSSGRVLTEGKVAALLELGSGFNPEFTGRENVYLNAGLLGLSSEQTDDRFDEIAAFADIGDHLDQSVKTYSSGMMLRLAFAVQIAVESEIMIIDEALAVGDARFQLKCFKRMEELKNRGTTILFVSHSTEMVRSFCNLGLVIDAGKTVYWGDAKAATVKYLEILFPEQVAKIQQPEADENGQYFQKVTEVTGLLSDTDETIMIDADSIDAPMFGIGGASLEWLKIEGLQKPNLLIGNRKAVIQAKFNWQKEFLESLVISEGYENNITLGVAIANNKGAYIFGCNGFDCGLKIDCLTQEKSIVEFTLDLPYLAAGDYFLTLAIALGSQKNHIQLRWYDCFMQLKSLETDKHVYGIFAVDYLMKEISQTEN